MATTNPKPSPLSDEQRRLVQAWLTEFERNWGEGRLAARAATLPAAPDPLRLPALLGLVRVDLVRSWQRGQRVALEAYLRAYPELATDGAAPLELVRAEYDARRRFAGSLDVAALAVRFPAHAAEVQRWATLEKPAAPRQPARATATPPPARETVKAETAQGTQGQRPSTVGEAAGAQRPLPEQFGRYRILKKLGAGGMGTVYLAQDGELDRPVALKVPHFAGDDDPNARARFRREAQAAATLSHPNLCPVYDVGEIDGAAYLTMAYIDGKPLSAFLRPERPFPQRNAAALVRKLAAALREAHAKGIVHRDVKPSNVMINTRNEPVIMDFGLARRSIAGDARLTKSGAILGTPAYMAPEQVNGDVQAIGPPCDVYALGVILYECLTGQLPFDGPVASVLARIMVQEPERPSVHRPDLDPALEAICLKAMAKKIEVRYASMAELHEALGAWLRAVPGPAVDKAPAAMPPPAPPRSVPAVSARPVVPPPDPEPIELLPAPPRPAQHVPAMPPRRRSWAVAAGAVALLAVIAGIVLYVSAGDKGTIRIELNDPDAVVRIDGEVVTIESLREPITLKPGEHELIVKRGDLVVETRKFTLQRGEKQILSIKLLEAKARPVTDREPDAQQGTPPKTPPNKDLGSPPVDKPPDPLSRVPRLPPPDVKELVRKLALADGWERYRAAEELRKLGKAEAVPALAKRVADDIYDPYPGKHAALEALHELAPEKAVEALASALSSKAEAVRVWACRELGRQRGGKAEAALAQAAKSETVAVRAAAAFALARQGGGDVPEALRGLLADKEARVRRAAVDALASIGGLAPVEAVTKALEDADGTVRVRAGLALLRLRERSAAEALRQRVADESWLTGDPHAGKAQALDALRQVAPGEVAPALHAALKAKSEAVRTWACQALAFETDKESIPLLVDSLKSDATAVRAAAALTLGMREAASARDDLKKRIDEKDEKDYKVRQAARQALEYLDRPPAVEDALKQLFTPNDPGHYKAAEVLKKPESRPAIPALMQRIGDGNFGGYSHDYDSGKSLSLEALKVLAPDRATEALLMALRSKNDRGRAWACGQLTGKDRVGTLGLVGCLEDRSPTVRAAAVRALGKDGASTREAVARLANDEEYTVRQAVLEVLAAEGGADASEACCAALCDGSPEVRAVAAQHLTQIGGLSAAAALMRRVADDVWGPNDPYSGKVTALTALRKLAPERVTEALLAALQSKSEQVRAWACAEFPARDRKGTDGLIAALKDGAVSVRKAAATALGQQEGKESVAALLKGLEDGSPEVRAAATAALGQSENEARDVLRKLLTDAEPAVRKAALETLTKKGGAEAVKLWSDALNDAQPAIRQDAAYRLQQLGDRSAVPALSKRVADDTPDVDYSGGKLAALGALRQLAPDKATDALLEALRSKNDSVRAWACQNLTTKDKQAPAALVKALKDDAAPVRRAAAAALGSHADADSAKALIESLRDGDPEVRAAAANALGYRYEKSALDELEKLQKDPDSRVQNAVQNALGLIKSKK
ncbi:MAG: HEAT repeat domain-containing protein [Planctomycetes bacterium]|nr:HEAT repeat domain-containing protein [Planctomycetota bacterium]